MEVAMKTKQSLDYRIGFLSVLFAAFLWGTAGTAASFAKNLSPIMIGTISVGGGGLIYTLLCFKAVRLNYQCLLPQKYLLLIGVVAAIASPITFYSSIALAGVSIGTVVSLGSAPLFSVILEKIFEKRKLSFKWLMSFFIGFLGVILLLHTSKTAVVQVSPTDKLIGVLFGVLSGLSYAIYSWIVRSLINKGIDSRW
jgi:DME family drug/metabolite transporter